MSESETISKGVPTALTAWREAIETNGLTVDTTGVSPSLDRLRDAHAGAGKGGSSSQLHDASQEIKAFGDSYGISCGLVWGHTGRDWDIVSELAGGWTDRVLAEHEQVRTPDSVRESSRGLTARERHERNRAARGVEPLTIIVSGKTEVL